MSDFDAFLTDFLLEAQERCDRTEELFLEAATAEGGARAQCIEAARREVHTIKGNAGMVGLREVQAAAHRLEDRIAGMDIDPDALHAILSEVDELRGLLRPEAESGQDEPTQRSGHALRSARVSFDTLDELVDLAAEMVVFRNRLDDAVQRVRGHAESEHWLDVFESHEALGKTLTFVQDRIMALRMVPLRMLFSQLRRIVHDSAAVEEKQARFVAGGGDTPVDKSLLECASDALGHIVRNAVVHGIEPPERRIAAGKKPEGRVQLRAVQQSDAVWIEVTDDGRGIEPAALLDAARSRGLDVSEVTDPLQLIFHDGLSTRAGADLGSGRGVGLSAALEAVRRIGGDIDVETESGKGTLFRLRLPLSVSVAHALLLRADGEEYALPLSAIVESIRFGEGDAHLINGSGVLNWRGRVIPLLDLGVAMGTSPVLRRSGYIVITETDGRGRGMLVDDLTGIREIIIKQIDLAETPLGIAGATILGDGRVLLILDPKGLAGISAHIDDPRSFRSHERTRAGALPAVVKAESL